MSNSSCYSITTRRFTLRSGHEEWLQLTQNLYNEILAFYHQLYLDRCPQERNSQKALRRLEQLTIVGRDKTPVEVPLPWKKVPLYFRRAAINAAIASGKSFLERQNQQHRTEQFEESVTYYKGMFRELTESTIELKVWTGSQWCWLHCRLSGNQIPEGAQIMSPSVVIKYKEIQLHVPVKLEVHDGRTVRERMAADEPICAAVFTNEDAAVVSCVLDSEGNQMSSFYIKGGREYAHLCAQVLAKVERSKKSSGEDGNRKANQKYWMKIKHLNEHYAHQFSRRLIDYCVNHEVKVLVLPRFEMPYSKYLMLSAGNWSPLHLSSQIREKIRYKAWQKGIVVLEMDEKQIGSTCSKCGSRIKRSGSECRCEQGHQGDFYLNMARILGKKCLNEFGKRMK